jgi:branched-chain amino acid transport system substrate-binding protein
MSEVKDNLQVRKNIVLLVYFFLLAFVGPLLFWLLNSKPQDLAKTVSPQKNAANVGGGELSREPLKLSTGQQILVTADTHPDKQAGVDAYAKGDYKTAIVSFQATLKANRNDPESLIYLSNATAALKGPALKIGVSVPIGGNLNVAREVLRGAAQAQKEINQNNGINGKLVQLAIANDNNDPVVARQIAEGFVADPEILAVIGHTASEASVAAAPVYQAGGLVMISPTSVARSLSGVGDHIFRTTPNTKTTANALAKHIVTTARKNKVVICYASKTEASKSFQEEFTAALYELDGKVLRTPCDFSDPSFVASEVPSRAVSDGAEAIVLAPSFTTINEAIDIMQANQRRLPLFGSQTMYVIEALKQGQADANGMVLPVPWHPAVASGSVFADNAKKLWGGPGNWRTAMAHDATYVALTGLKSGATREQLPKTLSNESFSVKGATGDIQFLPSGDRVMKVLLVRVQPGKESGAGYDFTPLKSVILPTEDIAPVP